MANQFNNPNRGLRRESISHRNLQKEEEKEEKLDLNELNRRVDLKIKDLLHRPEVDKVVRNLTTDDTGAPQSIFSLKEMVENEEFLKDLIFDQVEVDRFNQECDSIAEQTYKLSKEHVTKVEDFSKEMEKHNTIMKEYSEKSE